MVKPELLTGMGAALAVFLTSIASCVASVPAGMLALQSKTVRGFLPMAIAGVLAIYGIIVAVILAHKFDANEEITEKDGFKHLSAGLSVGLACLASGLGMAKFLHTEQHHAAAPYGTSVAPHAGAEQERMPLIANHGKEGERASLRLLVVLTFIEAIGLYGLIVGLILSS